MPTDLDPSGFRTFNLKTPAEVPAAGDEAVSPAGDDDSDRISPRLPGSRRGRSLSLSSVFSPSVGAERAPRSDTPQPSGSITPRRLSRIRDVDDERQEAEVGGLAALGKDQSVVLRERVERMYGPIVRPFSRLRLPIC